MNVKNYCLFIIKKFLSNNQQLDQYILIIKIIFFYRILNMSKSTNSKKAKRVNALETLLE